jgi:ATP-dependent DNA helicase RecG
MLLNRSVEQSTGASRSGQIETWGRGIEKIESACREAGRPAPTFEATASEIKVTFSTQTTSAAEDSAEDGAEVKLSHEKLEALLEFCSEARTRKEMQEFCGIKSDEYFRKYVVLPMLTQGLLHMTIPDKPKSKNQRYVAASD